MEARHDGCGIEKAIESCTAVTSGFSVTIGLGCPAVLKVAFVGEDLLPGSRAGDILQSYRFSYERSDI